MERIHVPIFEPLFLELQDFVDCIMEGKAPRVPARDGFNALRLADAIRAMIHERLMDANTISKPNSRPRSPVAPALTLTRS